MTADSKQGERAGESVLSRWSRRKLEARQAPSDDGQEPVTTPAELPTAEGGKSTPAEAEKPVFTDADMPDIDSLDETSDYSQFMSDGVSDKLRNLALRKLFHTPSFNIRDGLDEYDDDYTSFEKLGDIVTSDMKHRMEIEQQKLRDKLAEEQAEAETEASESAEPEAVESEADELETDDQTEGDNEQLARLDADADSEENGQQGRRHEQ